MSSLLTLIQTEPMKMTKKQLIALYERLNKHDDKVNADKIVDLYKKLIEEMYVISFTGHFSAGKSSMINALLGQNVLPKSPIPTSGNIVEITSGTGKAQVYFNDGRSIIFEEPYDINEIQAFCKDNQSVNKVAFHLSEAVLPKKCMLVDTPGIDAADDADRLMTESSLHLVDHLFYVMDYNHVQSEVNLYFLKQMQDRRIAFSLIVNQVDKHNEAELPFKQFTDRIKETFQQWGIKPEKIYYSSLIEMDHKYNDFEAIKQEIQQLYAQEKNIDQTILQSMEAIIAAHKAFLQANYEKKLAKIDIDNNQEIDPDSYDHIKEELEHLQSIKSQSKEAFQQDLQQTLKNAYLMPASLRDKAAAYLESREKDFKVGFFRANKKTEEEKLRRLESFLHPLQKNIEATIQWNFRDKVIALLSKYEMNNPELIQRTKEIAINYTEEDLVENIKPGAKVSGEYVLHYTNDINLDIKNKYKKQAQILWEEIEKEITKQTSKSITSLEAQYTKVADARKNQALRSQLENEFYQHSNALQELINNPIMKKSTQAEIESLIKVRESSAKQDDKQSIKQERVSITTNETKHDEMKVKLPSIPEVVKALNKTIEIIEDQPQMQTLLNDLTMKGNKLSDRQLTVALFGAFSAGKSSFANALLGEPLLPSSPNPTTAVINKIAPITEEYGHGEVVIKIKDEQAITSDLRSITKDLSPPETADLEEFIEWIRLHKLSQNQGLNETYQAYLHAITEGFTTRKKDLGQTITITLSEFATYISDEATACFIELVTLYYDCPLTRLGITLVDTPGADSVNARHTSVAFDYIKQADAILYVTYYNHALSRADRDFLTQLGRVKEAFQLDKMFFIVNAADLAESEADLKLVMDYVEEQLIQLGIRQAQLFPVSSKESLHNKLQQDKLNVQMQTFENRFYQFINEELPSLSIQSVLWDIQRGYDQIVRFIKTAQLNEDEKKQYEQRIDQIVGKLRLILHETDASIYEERITQRIKRQLYYIQERISIQFHDLFTDHFNPTTITQSGRKAYDQLNKQAKYLVEDLSYELLQELRAVSLRIEKQISELTKEFYKDYQEKTRAIDDEFHLPLHENETLNNLDFTEAFSNFDYKQLEKSLTLFKDTKSFFVKNEKEMMKENLFKTLLPFITKYIRYNEQLLNDFYINQCSLLFTDHKTKIKAHIHEYKENSLAMTSGENDLLQLEEKQQSMTFIMKDILQRDG